MSFNSLGLEEHLVTEVAAAGFAEPTSFQSLAIPPALSGRDVLGRTNGHPGKAEAFILPLLQHLSRLVPAGTEALAPRALVLTPTRKATQEVQATMLRYGQHMGIRVIGIFGGVDIEKQIRLLRRRTEVVVATPGRLLDHIARGTVDLTQIGFLVLDETDRMAEMGFLNDVRKIIDILPASRQSLMFSGTISPDVSAFAGSLLREPVTVDAVESLPAQNSVRQRFYSARRDTRIRMLLQLLEAESMTRVLVLSRNDHEAERIARILKGKGIASQTIRSDWTTDQREQASTGLKNGRISVLVGTHQLSDGIVRGGIEHVVNYDFPPMEWEGIPMGDANGGQPETITFVTDDDRATMHKMEQSGGPRMTVLPFPRRPGNRVTEQRSAGKKNDGRKKLTERTPKPVHKQPKPLKHRKKSEIVFARRKKPVKKMETFSSDLGGAGWSGY